MIAKESMTSVTSFAAPASAAGAMPGRRRVSIRSGRALEKLAHAIEYLTDEFVREDGNNCWLDGHLQAIDLLMSLNRFIYLECPENPTLGDRCRALVGRRLL